MPWIATHYMQWDWRSLQNQMEPTLLQSITMSNWKCVAPTIEMHLKHFHMYFNVCFALATLLFGEKFLPVKYPYICKRDTPPRMRRCYCSSVSPLKRLFVLKILSHTRQATKVKKLWCVLWNPSVAEIQHFLCSFPAESAHAHYSTAPDSWL